MVLRTQPAVQRVRAAPALNETQLLGVSDDRATALVAGPAGLVVVDVDSTTAIGPPIEAATGALAPDGTTVFAVTSSGWRTVRSDDGTERSGALPADYDKPGDVIAAWVSESVVALTRRVLGGLVVIDTATGDVRTLSVASGSFMLAIEPRDRLIAMVPARTGARLVSHRVLAFDWETGDELPSRNLLTSTSNVVSAEFVGDDLLVGSDKGVQLLPADGTTRIVGDGRRAGTVATSTSSSGRTLVTVDAGGAVRVYRLEDGGTWNAVASAFDPKATGAIVVDDTTVVVLMGDRVLDLTAGGDQPLSTNPIESTSAVPLVIGEDGSLYSIDNWVLARHIGSEPAAYRSTAYPWFTTPDGNVVGVEYGIGVAITLMQPDGTTIAHASGWDEVPAIVFDFEHERLLAAEQDGWNVLALSTRDLTRSNTGIELPPVSDATLAVSADGRVLAAARQDRLR